MGGFAILPSVELSTAYDDNANATKTDREEDLSAGVSGTLRAESLFERHSLGFEINAAVNPFDESAEGSLLDLTFNGDGRLDLTPRSSLSGAVRFTRGTEDAESPEAQEELTQTGEQATVTDVAGTVAYARQFRRLSAQIAGGINRIEEESDEVDELVVDDGTEADERDRTSYTISAGADYRLSRRLSVFAEPRYSLNDYDTAGDGGSRDSQLVSGTAGVRFDIGRTLSASFGGGYSAAFFEDPERDDEHAPSFEAGLDGAISLDRVTILNLGLDHSTELTTVEDSALVTQTRLLISITRSLSRVSAILASAAYTRSDFIGVDRTDNDIVARLGYSRTLTQNIALNVSYRFSQRFSDDDEDEFYRNIVTIGLSASF